MNPDNMQQQNMDMTPEDIRAALGYSNTILMGMMPKEAPQELQNAPETTEIPKTEKLPEEDKMMAMEGKMDEKMEILRDEMKSVIKTEVDSIRQMIQDALNDQD